MISVRWTFMKALGIAIRPLFGSRALCSNNGFQFGRVMNRCDNSLHGKGRSSGFEGLQVIFEICRRCRVEQEGWTEGRNIRIDIRWAAEVELMVRFAKELIALQPDLILANNTPTTAA